MPGLLVNVLDKNKVLNLSKNIAESEPAFEMYSVSIRDCLQVLPSYSLLHFLNDSAIYTSRRNDQLVLHCFI